jgi:carbon storage regulator
MYSSIKAVCATPVGRWSAYSFGGTNFSIQQWTVRAQRDEHQRGVAMLVLSRKKNESIIINDNITVTVIEIRGDKVRLGIEAPKHVTVHRREVYEAIQNQARALEHESKAVRPEA